MRRERVTFPKAGEKHSFETVIRAESAAREFYKRDSVPAAPPKVVLIFDRNLETCLLSLDWVEEAPGLYAMSSRCLKSVDGRLGVYNLGIGAPMASIAVEELVVQGAREFLIPGTAGGIATSRPGGLVLCTKALRDEGGITPLSSELKTCGAESRARERTAGGHEEAQDQLPKRTFMDHRCSVQREQTGACAVREGRDNDNGDGGGRPLRRSERCGSQGSGGVHGL